MTPAAEVSAMGAVRFLVDFGAGNEQLFDGVTLPSGAISVVEHREHKDTEPRRLPGRTEYRPVVLRRAATGSPDLYDWWHGARSGVVTKRSVIVSAVDASGQVRLRWRLRNAWPIDLSWPVDEGVLQEELHVTYDSFELE